MTEEDRISAATFLAVYIVKNGEAILAKYPVGGTWTPVEIDDQGMLTVKVSYTERIQWAPKPAQAAPAEPIRCDEPPASHP